VGKRSTIGIEEEVAFLCRPEAWPDPPASVELVEAHLSLVFLVGDEVFKLKKPVRFGRQDLRGVEARRRSCETEVRLNRRLAEEVYLGVAPLALGPDGGLQVGGDGEPVDWMVRMVRLPADRFLDPAIRSGQVDGERVDRAALRLACFYLDQPPALRDCRPYLRLLRWQVDDALQCFGEEPPERAREIARALLDWAGTHGALLGARVAAGRVVEGHGDLRPEHVCLVDPPVVIDCLEFDLRLRTLDCVDDLGFLAMECGRLGAPEVGDRFLDVWRRRAGDEVPDALVAFHQAMRALSRASVAAMRLAGCAGFEASKPELVGRLQRRLGVYLDLAEARLRKLEEER
jgi:uncharacterized protein